MNHMLCTFLYHWDTGKILFSSIIQSHLGTMGQFALWEMFLFIGSTSIYYGTPTTYQAVGVDQNINMNQINKK